MGELLEESDRKVRTKTKTDILQMTVDSLVPDIKKLSKLKTFILQYY